MRAFRETNKKITFFPNKNDLLIIGGRKENRHFAEPLIYIISFNFHSMQPNNKNIYWQKNPHNLSIILDYESFAPV